MPDGPDSRTLTRLGGSLVLRLPVALLCFRFFDLVVMLFAECSAFAVFFFLVPFLSYFISCSGFAFLWLPSSGLAFSYFSFLFDYSFSMALRYTIIFPAFSCSFGGGAALLFLARAARRPSFFLPPLLFSPPWSFLNLIVGLRLETT